MPSIFSFSSHNKTWSLLSSKHCKKLNLKNKATLMKGKMKKIMNILTLVFPRGWWLSEILEFHSLLQACSNDIIIILWTQAPYQSKYQPNSTFRTLELFNFLLSSSFFLSMENKHQSFRSFLLPPKWSSLLWKLLSTIDPIVTRRTLPIFCWRSIQLRTFRLNNRKLRKNHRWKLEFKELKLLWKTLKVENGQRMTFNLKCSKYFRMVKKSN